MTSRKSMFNLMIGPQRRDARQRFARGRQPRADQSSGVIPAPAARMKVGRSGPSRLARLGSEELARRLVGHEDEVHELEAEQKFVDTPLLRRSRGSSTRIVSMLQDATTMTCRVLVEVTSELRGDGHEEMPGKPVLADFSRGLMACGGPSSKTGQVPPRHPPLDKIAMTAKILELSSRDARVRRHMRNKRRLLIFWVLQHEERVKSLEAQCQVRRAAWLSQLEPIRVLPF